MSLLLVAPFAGRGPLFHLDVAGFTGIMSPFLAKTSDFARFVFVTFFTILQEHLMDFVVEGYLPLFWGVKVKYVGGGGGTREEYHCNH